jgi:hypothetical protein
MNGQSTEGGHRWAAYGKDRNFDIGVGMAVSSGDGQPTVTVMEMAGFGSTKMYDSAHRGTPGGATQAQSGTGYIKVDRTDVPAKQDESPLYVPFHGTEVVTPEQGLVLNTTDIPELLDQAERTRLVAAAAGAAG